MTPAPIYVDSSVVLHSLLASPARTAIREWLAVESSRLVSSRLLMTEVVRTMRRDGRALAPGMAILESIGLIEITSLVHDNAESIPVHVESLDALHLGAAMLLGRDTVIASHDRQMLDAAAQLGFPTVDPVVAAVGA